MYQEMIRIATNSVVERVVCACLCLCVPATLASWDVLMFRALGRTRKVTAGPRTLRDAGDRAKWDNKEKNK